jgi:hypothetical protein
VAEVEATLLIDRNGQPLLRLHIDPRCMGVELDRRRARVDIRHVDDCGCGYLAERLTVTG